MQTKMIQKLNKANIRTYQIICLNIYTCINILLTIYFFHESGQDMTDMDSF